MMLLEQPMAYFNVVAILLLFRALLVEYLTKALSKKHWKYPKFPFNDALIVANIIIWISYGLFYFEISANEQINVALRIGLVISYLYIPVTLAEIWNFFALKEELKVKGR